MTAFRALAFSLAGLLALGIGFFAARWSRERRLRRGDDPRPGIPTILAATVPVVLFALTLLEPDTSGDTAEGLLLAYFIYGAFGGFFAVPALILMGVVIVFAGESWARTERGRSRLDALTISIADGLIVLGLPLAVTAAYLQGGGPLFC